MAAALATTLVLLPAASASAAEYVWYYGDTASTVVRYEPSSSLTKQRSGVNAEVFQITTSVQTTAWLGSYHTTGGYSANVSGPLQYNATKAKWVWLISPNDPGKLPFRVAITRPGSGGMRIAETQPDPTTSTGTSKVNGTNLHAEWDGDRVTLYAENGEYTGSTWATRDDFEKHGVTIRFEGPNGAVQAHLLPDRFTDTKALASLGLTRLGNGLYLSPTNTKSGIVEIPSSDAARGLDATLQLAVYGDPGNG